MSQNSPSVLACNSGIHMICQTLQLLEQTIQRANDCRRLYYMTSVGAFKYKHMNKNSDFRRDKELSTEQQLLRKIFFFKKFTEIRLPGLCT